MTGSGCLGARLSVCELLVPKVVAALACGAAVVVCSALIHRIVRSAKRGKRVAPGLYLSLKQANRRITQLVLVMYAVTVFPAFTFLPIGVLKEHMLGFTLYLVTVVLAVTWLAVMAFFDVREIRRASRKLLDTTARKLSDELKRESRNADDG